MSVVLEDEPTQKTIQDLLEAILLELKLLNLRFEEAHQTHINERDVC